MTVEEILRDQVHDIVYHSDLRKITQRSVFTSLCDKYGQTLDDYKPFIYEVKNITSFPSFFCDFAFIH